VSLHFHCNTSIILSSAAMLPMSPLLIRFLTKLLCILVSSLRVAFRTYPFI
jgi:hypothetical protein